MPCPEKAALLEAYTEATKFYTYAVGQLKTARAKS
jgi:hypothetical protein